MKFGVCKDATQAPFLADLGFDYVEVYLNGVIDSDEERYHEMLEAVKKSGIQASAACLFVPGNLKLTGPDVNKEAIKNFLSTCFDRASKLGVKMQVFGSGGARQVPEGWPHEKAVLQLVDFLKLASPYAAKYGIQIAIEPLDAKECNIINFVSQGLELADLVGVPNVGVLADWYHMGRQNEGIDGILSAKEKLIHCHIAHPESRENPMPDDGGEYVIFFDALKKINYKGSISIESKGPDENLQESLEHLKTLAL